MALSEDLSADPLSPPDPGRDRRSRGVEARGVEVLYDLDNVPQTRNPMLETVFERTVRSLKASLRTIASDEVEVALTGISTTRCRTYMDAIELPCVMAVVTAKPWGGEFLVVLSSRLVSRLVETTLGGPSAGEGAAIEGRAFTAIETRIARWLIDALVRDAEEAFSAVSPVSFALDHIETIPGFVNIAAPSSVAIAVGMSVLIGETAASVEVFIPAATLEPIRSLLSGATSDEQGPRDEIWASRLHAEVLLSDAEIEAVLHEEQIPLKRIMALGIGDTLMFERRPDDPVELRCNGVGLAFGRAGRSGERLAIEVVACREAPAHHALPGLPG